MPHAFNPLHPPWGSGGRKKRVFAQTNLGNMDGPVIHQGSADLILVWDSTSLTEGAESYLLQSVSSALCNSFYFLHAVKYRLKSQIGSLFFPSL